MDIYTIVTIEAAEVATYMAEIKELLKGRLVDKAIKNLGRKNDY